MVARKSSGSWIAYLFLILTLALFAYCLRDLDLTTLCDHFKALGPGLVVML